MDNDRAGKYATIPSNPGNLGKLVILTGTPGAGKSTTAGIIAQLEKWVYYDGDGFLFGYNPYLESTGEEVALIGPGMAQRWKAFKDLCSNGEQLEAKTTTDRSPTNHFYRMMAEDIKKERERVGGDWVVASHIEDRILRDIFREVLDDAIFVVLEISYDLVKERLYGREKERGIVDRWRIVNYLLSHHRKFEVAQADEPRTVGFKILRESTVEENARAILDLINKAKA